MMGIQDIQEDFTSHSLPQPDPLVWELTRFQDLLKEKDNEISAAQKEIKALQEADTRKEKAMKELKNENSKLHENVRVLEKALQLKNLEMQRIVDEKKDALAAQFAAEAALRSLHENQEDDEFNLLPIESIIAPLEADIKIYKNEIASLQEDNKALERLTKSKEAALVETERILTSALERALIVEDIQNQNLELRRQIEIYQDENRILEKANRQKVVEVEKLSQTIHELEEIVLASGATSNVVRDYQRQVSELNEEKRTLERELARAKVSVSRVASVKANEWKDENDKVMPIKQWLEERRVQQAEMQRLKEKLAISERTAKAEAKLKEKFKLRLKTLEEGLKKVPRFNGNTNVCQIGIQSPSNSPYVQALSGPKKRSTSNPRGSSLSSKSSPLWQPHSEKTYGLEKNHVTRENSSRKILWGFESIKNVDFCGIDNSKLFPNDEMSKDKNCANGGEIFVKEVDNEDVVSGFLYDRLQKEVINLRKACQEKEDGLNVKDEEIKVLLKKVEALTKAMEVEARKMKKEASVGQKSTGITANKDDVKKPAWGKNFLKRVTKSS